jgi:hypothetical protein
MGNFGYFLEGELPGREADHSPPFSAEVKECVEYTSTPQYIFLSQCLIKHRDKICCFPGD